MFEWKVNQIRVEMMQRVLNHMEKQGYEVQFILPLPALVVDQPGAVDHLISATKSEVILAGKKQLASSALETHKGMPAVTPENLDVVYGREKTSIGGKSA
jgi:hypothetical protein